RRGAERGPALRVAAKRLISLILTRQANPRYLPARRNTAARTTGNATGGRPRAAGGRGRGRTAHTPTLAGVGGRDSRRRGRDRPAAAAGRPRAPRLARRRSGQTAPPRRRRTLHLDRSR